MLMHAYRKLMEVEDLQQAGFDCITYVPLSGERMLERGFNQAEQLARQMSMQLKLPLISTLRRVRHTHKQSYKRRSERLRDLGGAFVIEPAAVLRMTELRSLTNSSSRSNLPNLSNLRPFRILIIDDVYTTGSTLHQCAAVIREHISAQVYSLTWAR